MHPAQPLAGNHRHFVVAVLVALAFVALASPRLGTPGLYFDEVHQAPAAFTWLGKHPQSFNYLEISGVATMTMPYSGAIKSALFGLFMRVSGVEFSSVSWRMLGILMPALGLLICLPALARRFGLPGAAVFAALFLSDLTLVLTSRHDWGPTSLALLLRLVFLAVWLAREELSPARAALLGGITGFAVFEKLSSVALLPALFVACWGRRPLAWRALAGLAIGSVPLLVVNAASWIRSRHLISLSSDTSSPTQSLAEFVVQYLGLGAGDRVRAWTLDWPVKRQLALLEAALVVVLIGLSLFVKSPLVRRLLLCYALVGIALALLPRATWAHHWVLGTPFQYAGFALAASAAPRRLRIAITLVCCVLILARSPALYATESALWQGRAGARFDPSATSVAEFLASQPNALVIAATWGMGPQITCLAQGREDAVFEAFWSEQAAEEALRRVEATNADVVWLVHNQRFWRRPYGQVERLLGALRSNSIWEEQETSAEAVRPEVWQTTKFVRRANPEKLAARPGFGPPWRPAR